MKSFITLFLLLFLNVSYSAVAPVEVKEFLQDSIPADCAYAYIGECDNGYCWGEKEAFLFLVKTDIPQNPHAHSFKTYSVDGRNFETEFVLTEENDIQTLKMSLYRKAWAPGFPDRDGRDLGVSRFDYVLSKQVSTNKIVFAQETEYIKRRTFFGSLKKGWKQNASTKTCSEF